MRGKTVTEAQNALNTMRGTDHVAWTPYIGIFTTLPTDDDAAGVEASYSGYARQAPTFGAPGDVLEVNGAQAVQPDAEVVFPAVPADEDWEGFGIWDAVSGGNLRRIASTSTPEGGTIPAGQSLRLPAGTCAVIED